MFASFFFLPFLALENDGSLVGIFGESEVIGTTVLRKVR